MHFEKAKLVEFFMDIRGLNFLLAIPSFTNKSIAFISIEDMLTMAPFRDKCGANKRIISAFNLSLYFHISLPSTL